MSQERQQEPVKRSVKEILESARPENVPATAKSPSRRKTIDRRSLESDPKKLDLERRREDSDRRKAAKAAEEERTKSNKEKALELIRQRNEMKVQQHRKKKLLAGCEPAMGLNYDVLAMDDYPENALVAAAKRDRDYWLALSAVFGGLFLFGLTGYFSAFISGASIGLCVLSLAFAFTPLRKYFFERPPLGELLAKRKAVEFKAINHILFLEGGDGLAWRCGKMSKYNHNLARNMFDGVQRFSREKNLKSVLMSRKHIRLYLLFMIEAQKAYKRLQKDYLKNHFTHMEQGWDDSITDAEADKLSKDLGLTDEED